MTGNGFNSLGNFYHERTLLKIPLLATMNYNLSDKFRIVANLGLYGQNIVKDEYDVQGLHYTENQQLKEENLNINNWIDIQMRKTKIEASNIILKALIQSNYGK